jgi:hypothetical protein
MRMWAMPSFSPDTCRRTSMARLLLACALGLPMAASPSKLFTEAPAEVTAETAASGAGTVTTLKRVGGDSPVLASVSSATTAAGPEFSIRWQRRPGPQPDAAELDLLGLERLYAHVLQLEPTARFRFEAPRGSTPSLKARGATQGDVLRAIAEARHRAARELAAARSALKPTPWRIVSLKAVRASKDSHPDQVTVRVLDAQGKPLAGALLGATRGADMMCQARSDARGVATCKLIDTHGHGPEEHEDDGPVIVTFPGVVGPGAIDLPTTLRIDAAPKPHRH